MFKSSWNAIEEKVSELEDRSIKITPTKKTEWKKMLKNKEWFNDL